MGETISKLVFRPPKPTPIHPNDYFYLNIDVTSPLYFSKQDASSESCGECIQSTGCGSGISGMMCDEDSDLISLDREFLDQDRLCVGDNAPDVGCKPVTVSPNGKKSVQYKVPAFFVRRRGAKHTILFSHGNAEDLGMMYSRMKDLALKLCVNVMAYDYTGYGLSYVDEEDERSCNDFVEVDKSTNKNSGKYLNRRLNRRLNVPSENMIYRNIEAAYLYLTETQGILPRNIVLYGRSLGSGPSCYLAAKTALIGESVGGLILHSPFLSVYKVVVDVGVDVRGDMFNNEKRAGNIRCPTLIIHGKQDEVVPFWHARRLLAAIPPEFRAHPFYVNDLGHNHIESRERDRYLRVITDFLMKYVPPVDKNNESTTGVFNRLINEVGSRKKTLMNGHCDTVQHKPQHVNVIPKNERASSDEAMQNNSTFYINETWVRHAKVICREVFSRNMICNSAWNVVDWSSDGTREGSGIREGSDIGEGCEYNNGGNLKNTPEQKYLCDKYDDSRDDTDEFAPWRTHGESRSDRQDNSKMRYAQSHAPKSDEMIHIRWPQKLPLMSKLSTNKSQSIHVTRNNGENELRVNMNSGTRRRTGGR